MLGRNEPSKEARNERTKKLTEKKEGRKEGRKEYGFGKFMGGGAVERGRVQEGLGIGLWVYGSLNDHCPINVRLSLL